MEVLFRILHTHLENLKLPQRPVSVRLSLQAVAPTRDQLQLFESALRDPNRFGETLAKLKAFLGNENVGVPARSNTPRPDSYVLQECFPMPKQKREDTCVPLESLRGLPLRRFRPAISKLGVCPRGRPILGRNPQRCVASFPQLRRPTGSLATGGIANAGSRRMGCGFG